MKVKRSLLLNALCSAVKEYDEDAKKLEQSSCIEMAKQFRGFVLDLQTLKALIEVGRVGTLEIVDD